MNKNSVHIPRLDSTTMLPWLVLSICQGCTSAAAPPSSTSSAPNRGTKVTLEAGPGDVSFGFDWPETTFGISLEAARKSGPLNRTIRSHYQVDVTKTAEGGLLLRPHDYVVDSVTGTFGNVRTHTGRRGFLGETRIDKMGQLDDVLDGSFVGGAISQDLRAKLGAGAWPLEPDQDLIFASETSEANLRVAARNSFTEIYPGLALQSVKTNYPLTGEYVYALPLGGSPLVLSTSTSVIEAPVDCPDTSMQHCARVRIVSTTPGTALTRLSEQLTQILGKPVTVKELHFELKSSLILHAPTARPVFGVWEEDMKLVQTVDGRTETIDEWGRWAMEFSWR